MSNPLPEGDKQIIEALRVAPKTINELVDEMGVTANAVRQRLGRLMASGLIHREKSVEGRGRPSHCYRLTDDGHRTSGNNLSDLASALWEEVQAIQDDSIRSRVLAGVELKLAQVVASHSNNDGIESRLDSVREYFSSRDIPIAIETGSQLPVVKVMACPYPDLEDKEHHFCNAEKKLFERLLGGPVALRECRKDGDGCCSFHLIAENS